MYLFYSEHLRYTLSPYKGFVKSHCNFIQNPLRILCFRWHPHTFFLWKKVKSDQNILKLTKRVYEWGSKQELTKIQNQDDHDSKWNRSGWGSSKLGAQIIYEVLKSGCAISVIYLPRFKKWTRKCAPMRIRLHHPWMNE